MAKVKYGVAIEIYVYGGDIEQESVAEAGARGDLTESEARGIAKRLTDHLNEFCTEHDVETADLEDVSNA